MSCHSLLAHKVAAAKLVDSLMGLTLFITYVSLVSLKSISLFLTFAILITIYLGVDLFGLSCLKISVIPGSE